MILESKKIPFERYDISANSDFKDRMRKLANNPTALAPQLANGDDYCGVCIFIIICSVVVPPLQQGSATYDPAKQFHPARILLCSSSPQLFL